jgi:hypothetical protein
MALAFWNARISKSALNGALAELVERSAEGLVFAYEPAEHLVGTSPPRVRVRPVERGRRDEDDFRALGSRGGRRSDCVRAQDPDWRGSGEGQGGRAGLRWELDDPVAFAAELRDAAGPPASGTVPVELRRKALRSLLSRRVREHSARTRSAHRDTYARLKRVAGRTVAQLDEPALVRYMQLLEAWLGRTEHSPAGRGCSNVSLRSTLSFRKSARIPGVPIGVLRMRPNAAWGGRLRETVVAETRANG